MRRTIAFLIAASLALPVFASPLPASAEGATPPPGTGGGSDVNDPGGKGNNGCKGSDWYDLKNNKLIFKNFVYCKQPKNKPLKGRGPGGQPEEIPSRGPDYDFKAECLVRYDVWRFYATLKNGKVDKVVQSRSEAYPDMPCDNDWATITRLSNGKVKFNTDPQFAKFLFSVPHPHDAGYTGSLPAPFGSLPSPWEVTEKPVARWGSCTGLVGNVGNGRAAGTDDAAGLAKYMNNISAIKDPTEKEIAQQFKVKMDEVYQAIRTGVSKSPDIHNSYAYAAANRKSNGSYPDGLPCSSGLDFTVLKDDSGKLMAPEIVFGICYAPVTSVHWIYSYKNVGNIAWRHEQYPNMYDYGSHGLPNSQKWMRPNKEAIEAGMTAQDRAIAANFRSRLALPGDVSNSGHARSQAPCAIGHANAFSLMTKSVSPNPVTHATFNIKDFPTRAAVGGTSQVYNWSVKPPVLHCAKGPCDSGITILENNITSRVITPSGYPMFNGSNYATASYDARCRQSSSSAWKNCNNTFKGGHQMQAQFYQSTNSKNGKGFQVEYTGNLLVKYPEKKETEFTKVCVARAWTDPATSGYLTHDNCWAVSAAVETPPQRIPYTKLTKGFDVVGPRLIRAD